MTLSFRQRLKKGDTLIGSLLQMPLPESAEIFVQAGYDWLFVDMEHSPMDARAALNILTAVDSRVPCVVRVPWNDEAYIKKALDIGATGIIVPLVNTVEDARLAVARCKYPPVGIRSVGITRAQRYDLTFDDYMQRANEEIAVIVQIESARGIDEVERIAATPGVDCLYVGPADLAASLGHLGDSRHPDVETAMARVLAAGKQAGVAVGIFASDTAIARQYREAGYRMITLSADVTWLLRATRQALQEVRS